MAPTSVSHGLAYLFERFPTFTQTFCIREVEALGRQGVGLQVYSIHRPGPEPAAHCGAAIPDIVFLPERFDEILAADAEFRRAARRAQEDMRRIWGGDAQKRRIYEAIWLEPVLRRAGVRHIHVHFAAMAARTAFWLHRLFGVKYSVTAHANDIFRDEPPERLAQIFGSAEFVVTVSDFSVRRLRQDFPAHAAKFHRVYNGIDMERFAPAPAPAGRPLILAVGRYIEKKGFRVLIEACARLGDRDFECQIVGHGPLEEDLRALAAQRGLSNRVILTGARSEAEIKDLLARARVFALSCVTAGDGAMDNLPTVIVEAMAAGVPVVATSLAAIPEMVEDGRTGYLVEENDPDAVAERLAALLDDATLASEMGERGRGRCREIFDARKTSASLADLFQSHGALDTDPQGTAV